MADAKASSDADPHGHYGFIDPDFDDLFEPQIYVQADCEGRPFVQMVAFGPYVPSRAAPYLDCRPSWLAPQVREIEDWRKAWATPVVVELPNGGEWRRRIIASVSCPDVEITVFFLSAGQARVDILWTAMNVKTFAEYPLARSPEDIGQEIREYIERKRAARTLN